MAAKPKPIDPEVLKGALASQATYGIPASVSIAQFALESGWGKYMPPGSNNPFGMKTRAGKNDPFVTVKTREVIKGKTVYIMAPFRKFATLEEAFMEHGKLLGTAKVYAKAREQLKTADPADNFANALTGVYATDPNYGEGLREIMRGRNLYQYNDLARIKA